MNLARIQTVLEQDFDTELQPAGGDIPLERLLIGLENPQDDQQPFLLELAYVPGIEAELDDVGLLQYFVALDDVAPASLEEARRLLPHINLNLPLVGFNLHEAGQYFYFRYVQVIPKEEGAQDGAVVQETVWLIHYLLHTYHDTLRAVANGQQTVEQVLHR